jgi:hypothetical protein
MIIRKPAEVGIGHQRRGGENRSNFASQPLLDLLFSQILLSCEDSLLTLSRKHQITENRATNSCLAPQAASDANITTGVYGASSSRRDLMKVAQHFSAGSAVSNGIRPGGTIDMFELWPRLRGKASLGTR